MDLGLVSRMRIISGSTSFDPATDNTRGKRGAFILVITRVLKTLEFVRRRENEQKNKR